MTEDELRAIESRVNNIGAWPWHRGKGGQSRDIFDVNYQLVVAGDVYTQGNGMQGEANAEFVTHAPEDVHALLTEVRTLRELIAGFVKANDDVLDATRERGSDCMPEVLRRHQFVEALRKVVT